MITPEALSALRDRLIAATGPDAFIDDDLEWECGDWTNLGGWWRRHKITGVEERYHYSNPPAYTASIDAALGLVTRLLPGWRLAMYTDGEGKGPCCLAMLDDEPVKANCHAPTLPLALLTALVSALSQPGVQS